MFGRTRRTLLWAALFALLTACGGGGAKSASVPQTPVASNSAHGARTAQSTTGGSRLFAPNSTKYADNGAHPATGMSGSATIQSRALLGKDGKTLVEATTGTLDSAPGPGAISHVLLTPIMPDGVPQDSLSYSGTQLTGGSYWSDSYAGFARNMTLQLQNSVTGIDAARTDVVKTAPVVKLRPDLSVRDFSAPKRAYVHRPVHLLATVAELNGDVGARADCILSVDGHQVDQALGIWVDAGRAVSCDFQPTFDTTGTHQLSITAANVVPADWDLSNNAAQATIEIVDPIVPLGFKVRAFTESFSYFNGGNYYGNGGYGSDASVYIDAYSNLHTFGLPVQQITALITADGFPYPIVDRAIYGPEMSSAHDNGAYTCSFYYGSGEYASVCNRDGGGYSDAVYQRSYTDATYYGYYTVWYCYWGFGWGYCYPYTYYYSYGQQYGSRFDIGQTGDHFTLTLTDATGTVYRAATPPLSMQTNGYQSFLYAETTGTF